MKKLLILLSISIFLSSCVTSVTIPATKPPEVKISSEVKQLTLVNATKPSKKKKGWKIAESVLTGEMPFQDNLSVSNCISNMKDELNRTGRFIVSDTVAELKENENWVDQFRNICENKRTDALLILTEFDSDGKSDMLQFENEYIGNISVTVTTEWIFYDNTIQSIIDKKTIEHTETKTIKGTSETEVLKKIKSSYSLAKNAGNQAAFIYSERIFPRTYYLNRTLYTNGHKSLKLGAKYFRKGKWSEAVAVWEKQVKGTTNSKVSGRAAYNLAVAYESVGDLQQARYWAILSKDKYNFAEAKRYAFSLEKRIKDEEQIFNL